ncbi:hypothetical protein ACFL5X_02765 [Candidatus Omnitrophota bacterium]
MRITALLICVTLLLSGCVSFVDDSGENRKVKSFLITNDETLDMMEEMDKTPAEEKNEYKLFGGSDPE